jgi:hypothetical protein
MTTGTVSFEKKVKPRTAHDVCKLERVFFLKVKVPGTLCIAVNAKQEGSVRRHRDMAKGWIK